MADLLDCRSPEALERVKSEPSKYACKAGTANKSIKDQAQEGVDFYNQNKDTIKGGLDWIKSHVGAGKGGNTPPVDYTPTKSDNILGMPKPLAYGLGVVLLAGIGYGIYVATK